MHRTWPPHQRSLPGCVQIIENSFGRTQGPGVFANRRCQFHLVEVLEMPHPGRRQRAAPGQKQDRRPIEVSIEHTGQRISVRYTAAYGTNPNPTSESASTLSHIGRRLLVTHINKSQTRP